MKKQNSSLKKTIHKTKQIATKGTSATIISSILLGSCTEDFDDDKYNTSKNLYGRFAPNYDTGNTLLPINGSNFNDKFISHMVDVVSLINEITTNKDIATSFKTDPIEFIKERKYNLNFDFTDEEIRLLCAYTDDDVIKAINENDFEEFISICKNKGYIGLNLNKIQSPSEIRKYFNSEHDLQNYLSTIGSDANNVEHMYSLFIVAGAVVYIAGAVLIYGAVATIAAFWVGVATEIGVAYAQKQIGSDALKIDSGVLKLWTKENKRIQDKVLYEYLIEEQTNEIAEMLNKDLIKPIQVGNKTITLTEEQIEQQARINKEFIKINLEGYYGLRKFK